MSPANVLTATPVPVRSSAANSSSGSARLAVRTTSSPRAADSLAHAAPSPVDPPTMSAQDPYRSAKCIVFPQGGVSGEFIMYTDHGERVGGVRCSGESAVCRDQVGRLLADHLAHGVDVAARHEGHDRRVGDAE